MSAWQIFQNKKELKLIHQVLNNYIFASKLKFILISWFRRGSGPRFLPCRVTGINFTPFLLKRIALRLSSNRKQSKDIRTEKDTADNHFLEKESYSDKGGQKC